MAAKIVITNLDTGYTLVDAGIQAATFFTRLRGMLGKKQFFPGEGLVLTPCNAVHCFGMRFAIDVVFLNQTGEVIHMIEGMKPGSFSPIVKNACCVVELPAGMITSSRTKLGHSILMKE